MGRVLTAALLAILAHVGLIFWQPGWIGEQHVQPPRSQAVTVSMSYRPPPRPEEPPREKKSPRPEPPPPKVPPKITEPPRPVPAETSAPPEVEEKTVEKTPPEQPDREESVEAAEDTSATPGDSQASMEVTRKAAPLYKTNPPPEYPRLARRRGYQGKVVLSVHVNKEGGVDNLWVYESSGYRLLDQAALQAVRKWVFEPGLKGDRRADMWVNVPVSFELE